MSAKARGRVAPPPPPPTPTPTTVLDWTGVVLLCLTAALSALLESLLVPLYSGTVVVPVAVVLALAGNAVLPRLARSLVPTTWAGASPFVVWLVVVVWFGVLARPEGDVILPGGGPGGVVVVTYGVLLGGTLAGAVSLVLMSGPSGSRR